MSRNSVGTVLVGPSTLLRDGLSHILRPPRFRVMASAPSLDLVDTTALAQYKSSLLVIESGDSPPTVIEHIARFKQQNPVGHVAVLGNRWCAPDIVSAFQAGANVYFAQMTSSEEFLKAIDLILLGQTLLPSELLPWMQDDPNNRDPRSEMVAISHVETDWSGKAVGRNGSLLSSREQEILRAIAKGASNKLIAREFDISDATVKVHVKTILRKIGVANRTQAAIWSMTKGLAHRGEHEKPMIVNAELEVDVREK
jgi:DNA-binding NarL/FixJ family response regulator